MNRINIPLTGLTSQLQCHVNFSSFINKNPHVKEFCYEKETIV